MSDLASRDCIPCKGGVPPLAGEALRALQDELGGGWEVVDGHHLAKEYRFKNLVQALAFTNDVGALAEEINHHPELVTEWGRVTVKWWSHKIRGLHELDFAMAKRCDRLAQG